MTGCPALHSSGHPPDIMEPDHWCTNKEWWRPTKNKEGGGGDEDHEQGQMSGGTTRQEGDVENTKPEKNGHWRSNETAEVTCVETRAQEVEARAGDAREACSNETGTQD
ncbi:hypothetical protein NDU88_004434 [Pleurodeles waltl]|uniref:Uncharacterized protein n=1 Tax=Pleurodeles waltl TaxID=8319 RepID=A0AAV7MTW9_PLEWA|nr:hypothetical protein NDU88_004434 [Pleurodeles waltl]